MTKLTDLKEGDLIQLDKGFTCTNADFVIVVNQNNRLGFICNEGFHFLDGQLGEDDSLIGVSKVDLTTLTTLTQSSQSTVLYKPTLEQLPKIHGEFFVVIHKSDTIFYATTWSYFDPQQCEDIVEGDEGTDECSYDIFYDDGEVGNINATEEAFKEVNIYCIMTIPKLEDE